jgi:tetratricopeptide (TPR) repeat protein
MTINAHLQEALANQDHDTALALIDEAIVQDPENAFYYLQRGMVQYLRGQYDQAITALNLALELDPTRIAAHRLIGLARLQKKGRLIRDADYNTIFRLEPTGAAEFTQRGFCYFIQGAYDLAYADYGQALRLDPTHADAFYLRAHLHYLRSEDAEGDADYVPGFHLAPEHALADAGFYELLLIARANRHLDEHELEETIADFTEVIRVNPQSADAYNQRGDVYVSLGSFDEGIADFTAAIALDPENSDTWYQRAKAHAAKGEHELAVADFSMAIELNPQEAADAHEGRARAYWALGEEARAHSDEEAAEKLHAEHEWHDEEE